MKYLYVTYIDKENFVQTWADTVLELDNGTLIFMFNDRKVACFKDWSYWFLKSQEQDKSK